MDINDYAEVKAVMLGYTDCNPGADATRDGCVDISDYAEIRAIMLGIKSAAARYVAAYDFNTPGAGTSHLAAYKQVKNMPTVRWVSDIGWTNFSGGDYSDVEAIDASDFSMLANDSGYNAVQCRFTVDGGINLSTVTDVGIDFTGTSGALEVWAWNFDAGSWSKVCADISVPSGEGNGSGHTACDCWGKVLDSYVDGSGHLYVLFIHDDMNDALDVDYVRVELTYP